MARKIGIYGPAVIGERQFAEEQKIVEEKSNIYGPAVLDKHPAIEALEQAQAEEAEARTKAGTSSPQKKAQAMKKVQAAREKIAKARQDLAKGLDEGTPSGPSTVSVPADPTNETPSEKQEAPGAAMATDEPPDTVARTDFAGLVRDGTVQDVQKALDRHPNAVELVLAAELERDTPRKGALRAILEKEFQRQKGPRDEVVARIEEAL